MEVRDKLNTKEGYQEIIESKIKFIQKIKDSYASGLIKEEDSLKRMNSLVFKSSFDLLVCKYSIGEDTGDFPNYYRELVADFEKVYFPRSYYVQMLNMLSLGIMFDIENEIFDKLVQLIKKEKVEDFVYDFIIQQRDPQQKINQNLVWKKPYTQLKKVIDLAQYDKQQSLHNLRTYLNKNWYMSLFKTHDSEHNIHSGYWCFESGAVVKILGLDDSDFKEQKYYPYDLVHWKE